MRPTVERIQRTVAAHHKIGLANMLDRTNLPEFARPRMEAMYLARRLTGKTYSVIGRIFDRDHSTVLGAYNVVQRRIHESRDVERNIGAILDKLFWVEVRDG